MKNFIVNLSIKTKFLFFTLIASILPIIVLGGYAYISSINNIENHVSSQSITAMDRGAAFLDTYIQQVSNYSNNLASNSNIINILSSKPSGVPPSDSDQDLMNYNISLLDKNLTIPIRAIIIANDGSYYYDFDYDSAKVGSGVKTILQQSWYKLFYKFNTKIQFIGVEKSFIPNFETDYHFYFIQNIYNSDGTVVGTVVLDVSSYVFDRLLSSIAASSDDSVLLFDGNNILLANSSEDRVSSDIPIITKGIFNSEGKLQEGRFGNNIIEHVNLITEKWTIVYKYSFLHILTSTSGILMLTSFMVFVLLIFGILAYIYISNSVEKPIIQLGKVMKKFSSGNFEVEFNLTSHDEVGSLANGFNRMVREIRNSIEKIKKDERQIKELEFSILQAQINPHFLYNSLNSIKWMADLMGCSNITEAIQCLIKLLQYSVGDANNMTSFKTELQYIESYIYLNNLRFNNKFRLVNMVPKEYGNLKIMKFLIQPFVENAILHGFEDKPGMETITIFAVKDDADIFITIEDNGIGFDVHRLEEEMREGANGGTELGTTHIGIKNVDKRLKLVYGDIYGINIVSKPGSGTKVSIRIPLQGEVEEFETPEILQQ